MMGGPAGAIPPPQLARGRPIGYQMQGAFYGSAPGYGHPTAPPWGAPPGTLISLRSDLSSGAVGLLCHARSQACHPMRLHHTDTCANHSRTLTDCCAVAPYFPNVPNVIEEMSPPPRNNRPASPPAARAASPPAAAARVNRSGAHNTRSVLLALSLRLRVCSS